MVVTSMCFSWYKLTKACMIVVVSLSKPHTDQDNTQIAEDMVAE